MTEIILATTSKYRKKAFEELEIDFITRDSDVEEYFEDRPSNPEELVLLLARLKSESVAKCVDSGIIVGFDSIGYFNNEILEKPKSKEEAVERLKQLSNNILYFYTGVYMINLDKGMILEKLVKTKIKMRNLSLEEIEKYLNQDNDFMKIALGFNPRNFYSSSFVEEIEGSYNNLLSGLPIEIIMEMLFEIGYRL